MTPSFRARAGALLASMVGLVAPAHARADEPKPFRLYEAAKTAPWLKFGIEHRLRFEHLENDLRVANPGDATGLFLRTLVAAELSLSPVVVGVELQDARQYVLEGTPLNTTTSNPFELLQAYVGLRLKSALQRDDKLSLSIGRLTIDLQRAGMPPSSVERATRRLIARNEFRNTINGFTGVDLQWTSRDEHFVRFLAVFPVTRSPSDPLELADNHVVFDVENPSTQLWSAFYSSPEILSGSRVEGYVVGLNEDDAEDLPSANRRLLTFGARFYRAAAPGTVDFQLEPMVQVGTSRASIDATDVKDLNHLALSASASVGYQLDAPWKPRVIANYDYATGDADPEDDANNRFDTLYGARRFDWGPTGLYGAFARSNIHSPGVRFEVTPHRMVDAMVAYRWTWLASKKDAWTTAGLRDKTGASGDFIGSQIEGRVRVSPFPRNLAFDVGGAYLMRGGFALDAKDAKNDPAIYFYSAVTGTL